MHMPRPRKPRFVCQHPLISAFFPKEGSLDDSLGEVILSVEGLEAIRLVDLEDLDQEDAAGRMNVSRPTFSRILSEARAVVAEALVNGKILRIEGGTYELCPIKCSKRGVGRGFRGCSFRGCKKELWS